MGITFGTPTTISGDSDVNLGGQTTLDRAYDFASAGTLTINGVSFTNFSAQSSDTLSSGVSTTYSGYGSPASTSGDYATLLTNGTYGGGGANVTFNNLHAGDSYTIGIWVNDSRQPGCCGDAPRVETFTGSGVGGTTASLTYDTSAINGQFVYGTFIADGTGSETLNLNTVDPNTGDTQINGVLLAYTPSVTPEPASLVVWGLVIGTGLLVVRRRKA